MNTKRTPIASYKKKGLQIAQWANKYGDSYTIQKSWMDKKKGDWQREVMKLFYSELIDLRDLLDQAIKHGADVEQSAQPKVEYIKHEVKSFEDDDLPF